MSLVRLYNWTKKQRENEESVMRSYLLGDLDESVREEVQERVQNDKTYAERLSAAEDNLIDDYVFNSLSDSEREKFQANFLINEERCNKIRIAQAFEVYVVEKLPQASPNYLTPTEFWYIFVLFIRRHKILVTCSVFVIVFLAIFVPRFKVPAPNSVVSQINGRREDLEPKLEALNRNDNNELPAVEAILKSKRFREDGETQKVVVRPDTKLIKLKLQLPPGSRYQKYGVSVQTVEGSELFKVKEVKMDGSEAVLLKLTVNTLAQGDYRIQLMGGTSEPLSNVALYYVRLIHEGSSL